MNKAPITLVLLLLFLSVALPTAFSSTKLLILCCIVLLTMINSGKGLSIDYRLYGVSFFVGCYGLLCSIYGLARGAPGALNVLTVMCIYPIVLPFIFSYLKSGCTRQIAITLFYAASFIVVFDLLIVSSAFLASMQFVLEMSRSIHEEIHNSESAEYFKFTVPNISSLIFLIPFFATAYFSGYRPVRTAALLTLLALLFTLAVLSGRRALLLTMFAGPVAAYLLTLKLSDLQIRSSTIRTLFSVTLISIPMIYVFSELLAVVGADFFYSQIASIFEFQDNQSNIERALQFDALYAGIRENPFFGKGGGAAASYLRSEEMPWAYELFYVAIIFQYGAVGLLLYGLLIGGTVTWLAARIRAVGRESFEYSFLAGLLAFIFASATNPYLGKFDYMWILFVPYALVNEALFSRTHHAPRFSNA